MGDRNTKFFHVMATSRQRRNFIDSLNVGGTTVVDPNEMKMAVHNHFKNLYKEEVKVRSMFRDRLGNTIDPEKCTQLIAEFSEEEVLSAIKSCDGNKAPGPDGFNMLCIKKGWKFMKGEIMTFLAEFHKNGRLPKCINSSFITLVPKVENPIGLSDYRPISLIGCMYKILSKVLAARLKVTIPVVVGEVQSAFTGGKNIQDGILIANEVVDSWKKERKQGLIIKLDFQKAFGNLNWNYTLEMMMIMGFPNKWILWIKECLSSSWIYVLVNGSSSLDFQMEKGVRQGDPLSPFLFIIAVEGLNWMFKNAVSQGSLCGLAMGNAGPIITHLQFADDTLVFCKAILEEVQTVKSLLCEFEEISGLKINYHKSILCGVGITDSNLQLFAEAFNCHSQKLPVKYLGMPLGANPKLKSTWKPVIDKVRSRLASWKRRYISFGGRVVLIKSVLCSLPIFYMSLFKMPEGVIKSIESIQAKFLWGGSDLKKKLHMVAWTKITQKKESGGLGIKKIKAMNEALLIKWWWRFGVEKNALWRNVINSKYKMGESSWIPKLELNRKVSSIWKDIMSIQDTNPSMHAQYFENIRFKVGDGSSIKFWMDPWLGTPCLAETYPSLFRMVRCKDDLLSQVIARKADSNQWDLQFRRRLYDWEVEILTELCQILDNSGVEATVGSNDTLIWKANSSGVFSIKSMYELVNSQAILSNTAYDLIWRNVAPYRIQCFGWLVHLGKIKTSKYLLNIGIIQNVNEANCKFCGMHSESLDHLLLHCENAWNVWSHILLWWGIQSMVELLLWWNSRSMKPKKKIIWDCIPLGIPLAVMWSIWNSRNAYVF